MVLSPEYSNWYTTKWQSIATSFGCSFAGLTLTIAGASMPNFAAQFVLFASGAVVARSGKFSLAIADRQSKNLERFDQVCEVHSQKSAGSLMEAFYKSLPMLQTTAIIDVPLLPPAQPLYDWNSIADEAVGFLICGNSGSAKSSLATWLAGHLTQSEPMAVIALDPHYNDCWQLAGIKSVGKIEHIEACLEWLIAELDRRCERKGDDLPLGDPMFIICDEINAALERFAKPKVIESALKRLGSEGRKFDLTFCGLNQSSNAEALGIDSKYRSNYALILLGESARTHAKLGKFLQDVAYPCMVSGSIANRIANHPTHGSYQHFKKKGNPPLNLKPINQLPLPSALSKFVKVDRALPASELPIALPAIDIRNHLETLFHLEADDSVTEVTSTHNPRDLALAVSYRALLDSGYSRSKIVKEVMGKVGRNFENGKAELDRLLSLVANA